MNKQHIKKKDINNDANFLIVVVNLVNKLTEFMQEEDPKLYKENWEKLEICLELYNIITDFSEKLNIDFSDKDEEEIYYEVYLDYMDLSKKQDGFYTPGLTNELNEIFSFEEWNEHRYEWKLYDLFQYID